MDDVTTIACFAWSGTGKRTTQAIGRIAHGRFLHGPAGARPPKKPRRRISPLRIALICFGVFVLLSCGTLTAVYYYYTTNVQQPLSQFIHPVGRGKDETGQNPAPADANVNGRAWNILLMGSDNDGKFAFPDVLTQVMMVVHVDTLNNTVALVSIPRDSWVTVPEVGGMHKIDQAFLLGAQHGKKFDAGVQLARATIERDYGIPIDRYAWVGLSGFARVIDTLGGVDIDVTHPMVDDLYPDDSGQGSDPNNPYAYTRLYLAPGPQHLNGQQALAYVRTRHADLVGDIGRTERQQQVLEALKQKLNVTSVLRHLSSLLKDLQGVLYTDLSESEMLSFAQFGHGLNTKQISHITLGPGQNAENFGAITTVYDPQLGTNQSVIVPNCETIQPVVNRIFGLGDVPSCNTGGG